MLKIFLKTTMLSIIFLCANASFSHTSKPADVSHFVGEYKMLNANKNCGHFFEKVNVDKDKFRIITIVEPETTDFVIKGTTSLLFQRHYPDWNNGKGKWYRLEDRADFIEINNGTRSWLYGRANIIHNTKLSGNKLTHSVTHSVLFGGSNTSTQALELLDNNVLKYTYEIEGSPQYNEVCLYKKII